jgi:predicted kinase
MTRAKLIVLNGFAASGKTTIAKKYIADHSMAMAIEADELVDNIGDWTNHIDEVRQLTFELTKAMLRVYLSSGHDVILPYLILDIEEVKAFELIAHECDTDYYEVVLHNERPDAIARLLARGRWGEITSPPLTEKDVPIIEELVTKMEAALEKRQAAAKLDLKNKDPDTTYRQLLDYINA